MNEFGEKIIHLRKNKGLTQDSLAEMLGVTAQAVSKWERGESMPDVSLLPALARIFEVSIDSLFGIEQQPVAQYLPENQRDFEKMILHISIEDGNDRIKVNLPLPFIKVALEIGVSADKINLGNADLSKIDFASIVKMIESGVIGKIVEIEDDDGSHIVVEVV